MVLIETEQDVPRVSVAYARSAVYLERTEFITASRIEASPSLFI